MSQNGLSNGQIQQFHADGYLILRQVLPPDVVWDLASAGDRLLSSDLQQNRQSSENGQTDSFRNCIVLDDVFVPLLTQPRILAAMIQLLSANIQLVTSHLIHKKPDPPETPRIARLPGWHRDIAGTPSDLGHAHIPKLVIKCAYALGDLTHPDSGVTRVVPGSHRLTEPLAVPSGADPEGQMIPRLSPGDALLFENRTWHAAGPVLNGQTRRMLMYGYGYRWLRPMDYMVQPPELMAKVDGVGKQLLGGDWHDERSGHFTPGGRHDKIADWAKKRSVKAQAIDPQFSAVGPPAAENDAGRLGKARRTASMTH